MHIQAELENPVSTKSDPVTRKRFVIRPDAKEEIIKTIKKEAGGGETPDSSSQTDKFTITEHPKKMNERNTADKSELEHLRLSCDPDQTCLSL